MSNSKEIIRNFKTTSSTTTSNNIQHRQEQLFLINSLLNNTTQQSKTSSFDSLPPLSPQNTISPTPSTTTTTSPNSQQNNNNNNKFVENFPNATIFTQLFAQQPNLFLPLVAQQHQQQQQLQAVAAIRLLQQQQQQQFNLLLKNQNVVVENCSEQQQLLNKPTTDSAYQNSNFQQISADYICTQENLLKQFSKFNVEHLNKLKLSKQSTITTTASTSANSKENIIASCSPQAATIPWYSNYINMANQQLNGSINPLLNGWDNNNISNNTLSRFPWLYSYTNNALAGPSTIELFKSHNHHNQNYHNISTSLITHKRKGGQIRFSNEQTDELETIFDNQKYLTNSQRKKLAKKLILSERQIKTWFQNRRAKWRRIRKDGDEDDELLSPLELNRHSQQTDDDDDDDDDGEIPLNCQNSQNNFNTSISPQIQTNNNNNNNNINNNR